MCVCLWRVKFFRSSGLCVFPHKRERRAKKTRFSGDLDFPALLIVFRCFSLFLLPKKNTQKRAQKLKLLSLSVCVYVCLNPLSILLKHAAIINRARNDNNNNNSARKSARVFWFSFFSDSISRSVECFVCVCVSSSSSSSSSSSWLLFLPFFWIFLVLLPVGGKKRNLNKNNALLLLETH